MSNRAARVAARVAGLAWLSGFALFVYFGLPLAIDLQIGGLLMSFFTYALWALLLGIALVRRPGRGVVSVSLVFGLVLLALYAPTAAGDPWLLLALGPDAIAAGASLVALVADRVLGRS